MEYGMLTFQDPIPDYSRKIIHIDMDAFYASVEERDNPSLKKQPVVIAKHPKLTNGKGIVSTCNYIARSFGIHSAMPSILAFRACPQAQFIEPRMTYYAEVSRKIREIFYQYSDLVEPLSLDEAYLDVTVNKKNEDSAIKIALLIQKQIKDELNLSCSVGVSYNKFLAKIASDYRKPNGLTVILPHQAQEFLQALPIEKFYGIGKKSVQVFKDLNIHKGSDLLKLDLKFLVDRFGKLGYSLYYKVRGIHNGPVETHRSRKSIGRERTYNQSDLSDKQVTYQFTYLCRDVMRKLREKGLITNLVTIKIRYENFETHTRQVHHDDYFDDDETCLKIALKLWHEHGNLDRTIRLLGVSVSNLVDPSLDGVQLILKEELLDK